MIHPMVRDLYKRVLMVSKDYPSNDHHHIKQLWKDAIRNPENCPSWYTNAKMKTNSNPKQNPIPVSTIVTTTSTTTGSEPTNTNDINELYHAVHRGRQMVKEMIGIVQLHKYRSMKQRYNTNTNNNHCNNGTMITSLTKMAAATEQYNPTNDNRTTTMTMSNTTQNVTE